MIKLFNNKHDNQYPNNNLNNLSNRQDIFLILQIIILKIQCSKNQ